MSADQVFAIVMTAIVTSAWSVARILRGPLGEALARRIGGDPFGSGRDSDHEAALADLRTRLAELEDRQDFTERALLQDRQQSALQHGGRS